MRRSPALRAGLARRHRGRQGVCHRRRLPAHHVPALGAAALTAREESPGSYRLRGHALGDRRRACHVFVTGALLPDGRQLLIALPADRPGLIVRPSFELAALQASCTTEVTLEDVRVEDHDLLADPNEEPSTQPGAVGTAGLETSALALGQARAALGGAGGPGHRADRPDRSRRCPLRDLAAELVRPDRLCPRRPGHPLPAQVRAQANALVLRTTQAYLAARKGTGFLRTEPAQRWARQALFFLVWSCPTPIAQAAIRDLAGLCPA